MGAAAAALEMSDGPTTELREELRIASICAVALEDAQWCVIDQSRDMLGTVVRSRRKQSERNASDLTGSLW